MRSQTRASSAIERDDINRSLLNLPSTVATDGTATANDDDDDTSVDDDDALDAAAFAGVGTAASTW